MTRRKAKSKTNAITKKKPIPAGKAKTKKAPAASASGKQLAVSTSESPAQLKTGMPESGATISSGKTKQNILMEMLGKKPGATIDAIGKANGWLPHTSRAMISGLRKAGHKIEKEPGPDGKTLYRIVVSKQSAETASRS